MDTPTSVLSVDDLNKPVLRPDDSIDPAPDPAQINIDGLRNDYRSMDTRFPTTEELASNGVVSDDSPPITPLQGTADTPYVNKEMGGLHRRLLEKLLAKQNPSPPASPPATQESIVTTTTPPSALGTGEPTQWQPTGDFGSAYDTDTQDSGSEVDIPDGDFSPPITAGSESPPTPASDVGEYFPNVSDTSGEDSVDQQKLSGLHLSDTSSWRSLDTVYPADETLEKFAQERSAELAEPAVMMTPGLPDPNPELDDLDFDDFEAESPNSPPASRTPLSTHSDASSLVLLAVSSDGSVSKVPFDVVSVDSDSIVVSIGSK